MRRALHAAAMLLATAWPVVAVGEVQPAVAAPPAAAATAPDPREEAQARHRRRLEREIATLEREITAFPAGLDDELAARQRERVADGLEVWDLTDERSDLRQRIERLRERITLLEQIQQRQDDVDRARLVEHQRLMADLASDRAVARANEDESVIDARSAERLIAAREAKRELLAYLHRKLDAIGAPINPPAEAPKP